MTQEARLPRLAVLIDAENASAKIAEGLFEEIAKLGEASVRRIYGDFSAARSKGWAEVLARYAIVPQQQFAYTSGKNASDITLVIDAMDLLHRGRFDGFCLVSSDSDFTRLAARIREEGVHVYGFGENKTPESFRQACHKFFYTETLAPAESKTKTASARPVKQAEALLKKALSQDEGETGWVGLGELGSRLSNLAPDFVPRNFGFSKLSDLVRSLPAFEVDKAGAGGHLRLRQVQAKPKGKTPKSDAGE
ncbi:NYN domain-containing protein [Zavarzinia compransoris]|uniref:Maebl n=1 Tax=Zavarzinia compransoris TaxID=1264899 RepID=A0A317E488_9PROT|nr:NYN domain-containing protein [Zavarzinia compransoris]PWR21857.1 Maebl [Zavarzinia compransoris]TDP45338.1 uncharacterized LabA/DUF88 family protein [Zavarzinia compransoris]